MYFNNINNIEDLKKMYKILCLQHHPDKGGIHENFIEMVNEYEKLLNQFINNEKKKDSNFEFDIELDNLLREKLNLIISYNVIIEIIGNWIWITGNTYQYKDNLKEFGFKFSKNKTAWYWHSSDNYTRKSKKSFDLDEIRKMHGSVNFKNKNIYLLTKK